MIIILIFITYLLTMKKVIQYLVTKIIKEKISINTTISKNKNPKENKYLQLDSTKIKKELGWVAKTSLNEAQNTNWYLKVFEKDALEFTKQQILNHFKKNNLVFNRLKKICLIIKKKLMMKNF